MSEAKSHQFRPPLYNGEQSEGGDARNSADEVARNEQKGWDAYRKWLASVSGKAPSERAPVDNSIYSWKGYHNWADRVRQSWKSEDN